MGGGELSSVADYRRWLVRAGVALVTLGRRAVELGASDVADSLEATLVRLESWLFSIAVVGEFKKGKSTFLNALLRAPVLPTDAMPATATISRVVYGRERRAEVVLIGGRREPVPIEALRDWITYVDEDAAERSQHVREAVIHWDTAFCWDNVQLVDTPGLNDPSARLRLREDVLPDTDAAIMVVSATEPFAESEAKLLAELVERIDPERLFFVVSMIDRVASAQATRVIAHVEGKVRATLEQKLGSGQGLPAERIFGLSALQALSARAGHDDKLLAQSQFAAFETALRRYLERDRAPAMLQPVMRALEHAAERLQRDLKSRQAELARRERSAIGELDKEASDLATLTARAQELVEGLPLRFGQAKQQLEREAGQIASRIQAAVHEAIAGVTISPEDFDRSDALKERIQNAIRMRAVSELGTCSSRLLTAVRSHAGRERKAMNGLLNTLKATCGRASTTAVAVAIDEPSQESLLGDCCADLEVLPQAFNAIFHPSPGSLRIGMDGLRKALGGFIGGDDPAALQQRRVGLIPKVREDYCTNASFQAVQALKQNDPAAAVGKAMEGLLANLAARQSELTQCVAKLVEGRSVELQVERVRREKDFEHEREELAEAGAEIARIHEQARAGFAIVSAVIGAVATGRDGVKEEMAA